MIGALHEALLNLRGILVGKENVMVSERANTDAALEFIRKIAGEISSLPYDREHQGAFAHAAALHYAANVLADRLAQIAEAIERTHSTLAPRGPGFEV